MSKSERGSSVFKPKARLLNLLGDQLITNEVVAVVELVKNAFDADATNVNLVLENVSNQEEGEIVVEDNGTGMTLDTILNVWLEPGTEYRKLQRDKGERTAIYKRPLLGEKGIGRFAAHRLGNVINVITRTKDSDSEVEVEVNWLMFGENKYLNEIPVNWIAHKPKVFVGEKHGTMIIIRDLKKAWNQSMVENLREKLEALQAPLHEKYNFEIHLSAAEFPDIEKKEKVPLEDILRTSLYSFEGSVTKEGQLQTVYRFKHPTFPERERKEETNEDLRLHDKRFALPDGGYRSAFCGPFDIRIHAWDLDVMTLKETVSRRYYDKEIQPRTGVRIYRDGFRVWPYGEPGNDWLNLDIRRVNNPTKCVSNNQVIGIINVSGIDNPKLLDKTDREGIIENEAFEDFRSLVLLAINQFEIEREKDKISTASLREEKKRMVDRTTEAIDSLREKMKKQDDYSNYEKEVKGVENAYVAEVKETIEPMIVSAGIGIAYLMPAHEIIASIQDLEKLIKELESQLNKLGVGGRIAEVTSPMLKITEMIRDVADGALELTRKKSDNFPLRSAIEFACYIKEPSINAEKIRLNVMEKDKVVVRGQKNLVMTCILNALDNSLYWLSDVKDKLVQIIIDHDHELNPRVVISDNGPGIRKEDLQYLGEAFWTRKPNGTGLGLFISKRAMRANNGEVDFGFYGDEPDFLSGANIILRFRPEDEIRG